MSSPTARLWFSTSTGRPPAQPAPWRNMARNGRSWRRASTSSSIEQLASRQNLVAPVFVLRTVSMNIARAVIAIAFLLVAAPMPAYAAEAPSQAELRAAKAFDDVRGDPLALHDFLKRMPKGGELHLHLHSAVFAETLIGNAIDDKLCVDPAARGFAKPQSVTGDAPACGEDTVP